MEDHCPHSMQDWYRNSDGKFGCRECDEQKEQAKTVGEVYLYCPHCNGKLSLGIKKL